MNDWKKEFSKYYNSGSEQTFTDWIEEHKQVWEKEAEIACIKRTLSRINLNEANAYPLIDESRDLKDVKEALINRLRQLQA